MLLFNGRIKSDISNTTATRAPAVATYVAENVKMSNEKIKVVAVPIRLHQQPHSHAGFISWDEIWEWPGNETSHVSRVADSATACSVLNNEWISIQYHQDRIRTDD